MSYNLNIIKMKTPREYIKNLKNNIITVDMLNDVLYSFNKRAKNCRDQKNRYRNNYYTFTYFDNYSNYEEKEQLFYKKKQDILEKLVKPKCLHKQKIDKRKRIYDYEPEYNKKRDRQKIIWENCYFDYNKDKTVWFYDIYINSYLYFIYYEIGSKGYHTVINETEYNKLSKIINTELLPDDFMTEGHDINDLLSLQFSNKVYDYIMKNKNIIIS